MAAYLLLSIVYYNEFIPENLFTEDGNIWISHFKNISKTYFTSFILRNYFSKTTASNYLFYITFH